ncbi:MAG: peptide deformylase [Thermoleophilia bacterium]|nr:peptide deformylase [Thermoleophilia bacterium]
MCNPEVIASGDEQDVVSEGCLSLGEVTMDVARPTTVAVAAFDPKGSPVELRLEGFEARVIQHEIDHLNGVLIIDKAADPDQRRAAMRELRTGVAV